MLANAGKSVQEIKPVTFTGSFRFGLRDKRVFPLPDLAEIKKKKQKNCLLFNYPFAAL